jgi:micrococcal nuclease
VLRRSSPVWLLLAVVLVALGYGKVTGAGGSGTSSAARVVRVVDGDTIVAAVGGRQERVRYIGVDTPETVKPGTPVQCFGKKASARNQALLPAGTRVRLETDAEERDRYGRLLAYVYRDDDGLFVNASLVRDGYATVLTIRPNVAHADQFTALARAARKAGRGLWNACSR